MLETAARCWGLRVNSRQAKQHAVINSRQAKQHAVSNSRRLINTQLSTAAG
ncbi:MAG: hypothetical protein IJQ97_04595 [Paludibacteraceae bacterium]|nr:hypothetical protein [Paludibacteraceae bacterium]